MFVLSIPCKDTIELYPKKENAIARLLSGFAKDCFCGPDIDEEFTFLKEVSNLIKSAETDDTDIYEINSFGFVEEKDVED